VQARRAVWSEIRAFAATGGTVLLTTHYLEEAEALATRVTVLVGGRRAGEGRGAGIRGATGLTRVRVAGPALDAPGVTRTLVEDDRVTYLAHDPDALVRWLVEHGVSLAGVEVRPATLEEAFVSLTEAEP
jgi:ABC-2 type transport system ATP-binding protein